MTNKHNKMRARSDDLTLVHTNDYQSGLNDVDLNSPELYINHELSLLEFNRRVIEQAKDKGTPLLERLRFLCIASCLLAGADSGVESDAHGCTS